MKITIFALIAALCFVAVSVNAGVVAPSEDIELDFIPQEFADEIVEIEALSVFGSLYFTLRAALRTVKGVNCSIKGVFNIRAAAQNFLEDIIFCGGTACKQVQTVVDAVNNVLTTCNTIVDMNESVCPTDDENATQKTGKKCFSSYLKQMITLKKQVSKVISLVKKVPSAGVGAGECTKWSLNKLTTEFMQFPVFVKNCSKLTSN